MGRLGEGQRLLVRKCGDDDLQGHGQAELALLVRAETHLGTHARVAEVGLRLARHQLQRGVEARRVARCEELLGVGAVAGSAELLGGGEAEVDAAVAAAGVSVATGTGGEGRGGVQSVHRVVLLVGVGGENRVVRRFRG